MKIYMHWDMEGVSGVFTREHVWYWEEGVREHIAEEGRQLLIADVNSAAAAVLEAGVDEVIVCDTHHGGALPMTVTIRMKTAEKAKAAAQRPEVRQIDEYTVEGHVEQQCDVVKWILVGLGMHKEDR